MEGYATAVLLLIGGLVLLTSIYRHSSKTYQPLPLLGHVPWFALGQRQRRLEWLLKGSDYHDGKSWRLTLPFVGSGYVLEDPACIKHVLSTRHDAFGKGELAHGCMKDLFGEGIILVSGAKWKSQRQAGHAAFSSSTNLAHFLERILPRHLDKLCIPLDKAVESGRPVDLQRVAYEYAMAVFGELAYDSNFSKVVGSFAGPFDRSAGVTQNRFFNPFFRLTEWLLPYGKQLRADIAELKAFGTSLVQEGKERLSGEEEGEERSDEHTGMLLKELINEHPGDAEVGFLADSCLNYLTAGRDTTAQALAWTVHALLQNPDAYSRCLAEAKCGNKAEEQRDSSAVDMVSMLDEARYPYINATILESLRLHPPVPLELHENVTDTAVPLPDGTVILPGAKVVWSPWAMGRSARIWGLDAAEFRPERWMTPADGGTTVPRDHPTRKTAFEFPVFHAGPRSCLGKQLARVELAYALAFLLERYTWKPAWRGERTIGEGLTGPIAENLDVYVYNHR